MTTRDQYFLGSNQTLYEDVRVNMAVFRRTRSGSLNVASPVATFDQLFLTSVQETNNETTQVSLSSDAAKLYAFGKLHRFYTFQAFILDSDLDSSVELERPGFNSIWTGKSYAEWQDFYNNYAKLSKCARERWLVQLSYGSKKLLCTINQMSVSTDAAQPHKYDLVFSAFVFSEENLDVK